MKNMNGIDIWLIVTNAVVLGITNFITFFFTRKKYNSEVKSTDLENISKTIGIYKEMVDDLSERISKLNQRLVEMETTIEELKKENEELKSNLCNFPNDCKFLDKMNETKNK